MQIILMCFIYALDLLPSFYPFPGKLGSHSLPIKLAKESMIQSSLRFPGKVCLAGEDIAIADTGNNRVVLVTKDGMVKKTIGGSKAGWKEGGSREACFNAPQGVRYLDGELFVADTENHIIRKVSSVAFNYKNIIVIT